MTHSVILSVTQNIIKRSQTTRAKFFDQIKKQADEGKSRRHLSCGNLAHAIAATEETEKTIMLNFTHANVGIITAYNDMLSAHQTYKNYPDQIKATLKRQGHTAQIAGGVPAMCDGVTQGQPGMDMSLFSRDLIAQSTAFSLSHNVFDATLLLGICDKIAPGQLMGALSYAHLPTAFIPAGPMSTGVTNEEKIDVRQKYIAGEICHDALQKMECSAYHSAGTCTFYGTANTNQLVFEAMGLMLPGSAFVPPSSVLRSALTEHASMCIATITADSPTYRPLCDVLTEKSLVNGLVALLSSGGSSNHTIHMIAIARAAGIILTWEDLNDLSDVIPLLVKIYPNGPADINAFQNAGGVPALMKRLHENDLLHTDVLPTFGTFKQQLMSPSIENNKLVWCLRNDISKPDIIATSGKYFQKTGGIKILNGNLGRAVIKVSSIATEHYVIEAPAKVFTSQHEVEVAYKAGKLNQDLIIVVTHNGPAANGMPELHKLMPILGNIQKAGFKVALVTDGRLSGASGKIPAAIHVSPEALHGGIIGLIQDGDLIRLDCLSGQLNVLANIQHRTINCINTELEQQTWGRALFKIMRENVSSAEYGASFLF